ncbi:hypothetical protein HPP92_005929 [Vanilla planifolia]|uniref:FAD-binding PCMH-type domain-containing protein n=1 Tax=Vanilla planifolia TaxID=51239 RepID=A0A835RI30_VANPL|nr:hypothetical protein HPP92_005929 [Vanilla planifolia]
MRRERRMAYATYRVLLCLLLLSPFSSGVPGAPNWKTAHAKQQSFLSCLRSHLIPSHLIFTPGHKNYTALFYSSVRNYRILTNSSKPLAIITPTEESHAQATVSCSVELEVPIRIRSGGHDYEGLSYASTISPFFSIVDLQRFRSVKVDVANGTAWVQAGATLGELYYAIAMKSGDVAFPAGSCHTVGVGGHFSGGGLGTLTRSHGLAIDQIIDARVVTAKGQVVDRESMGEDLFWALRGGGAASFGLILSYRITLVRVPPKVTVFSKTRLVGEGAINVVTKWGQMAYKLDERIFLQAILTVAKDNKENRTVQATFSSMFLGEKTELVALVGKSIPELELKADECTEMSWIESVLQFDGVGSDAPLSALLDRSPHPSKIRSKSKSDIMTTPIGKEGWEEIFGWMLDGNEWPMLILDPLGGKMDDISETATPFPHRKGSLYDIQYIVQWTEKGKEEASKHLEWMQRFFEQMTPYVSSEPRAAYLNYRDLDLGINGEGNTSYAEASVWGNRYFKGNFKRLAQVKTAVDPANFFRFEQSIPLLV